MSYLNVSKHFIEQNRINSARLELSQRKTQVKARTVTNDDLKTEGRDQRQVAVEKRESKRSVQTPLLSPSETHMPAISIASSDNPITIQSKRNRIIDVDRKTGLVISDQKTKGTIFERISRFDPSTFPTDNFASIDRVGYYTTHKQYITPQLN